MLKKETLRVDVVKSHQKEERLTSFITEQLDACIAGGRKISVLARSLESPVMRALATLAEAGRLAPIEIHALLLETATGGERAGAGKIALPFTNHEFRIISDRRMLDAHEQMVLAPTICWIGDCMRRDPLTRDAFETVTTTHREATSYAQSSFDRLWAIARPLALRAAPTATSATEAAPAAELVPPQAPEVPGDGAQTFSRQ